MADTYLITVAEAIKEEIDSGTFDLTFDTKVLWGDRKVELSDEKGLRVDVVPINWTMRLSTRGVWAYVVRTQVGVRKKFSAGEEYHDSGKISAAEIKPLVNLLRDLIEMFAPKQSTQTGRELTSVPTATWVPETTDRGKFAIDAMIEWEMLERRQFLGWFDLVYEVPA